MIRYSVFITPRENDTTFADEVDVSDSVFLTGVSSITRSIDSTDFGVGVFRFGDITIKADNSFGIFSDEFDSRSIFKFSRDRASVRVVYTDESGDTISFSGFINEESTKIDMVKNLVSLKVLSKDSVIRNTTIPPGAINNGVSVFTALKSILNRRPINQFLNYSDSNINPAFSFNIDDGSVFDNEPTFKKLVELMIASNSVLLIDSADNIIVRNRNENAPAALALFGPGDVRRRENIIKVSAYNTGLQRLFTSVKINNVEASNQILGDKYGFRQNDEDLDFITSGNTALAIAENLLEEFKAPKQELKVTVETAIAKDLNVLDKVTLEMPPVVTPIQGKRLPVLGTWTLGDPSTPLPNVEGGMDLSARTTFKVIEIKDNPKNFQTTLKLREVGTELRDGVT